MMRNGRRADATSWACVAWAAFLIFAPVALSGDTAPTEQSSALPEGKQSAIPNVGANLERNTLTAVTVTTVLGNRGGFVGALIVEHGGQHGAWIDNRPVERVVEVAADRDLLIGIEQRKPVAYGDNPFEAKSYDYLVLHARDVPLDKLRQAARRDLTRTHLMEQPERYKGELVHLTGIVRRLIKYDAPKSLWNDNIKELYEAWIFPAPTYEPCCVIVTNVPKGTPLGEDVDIEATCNAYFFKRYVYPVRNPDGGKPLWRHAPLLIGNTLEVAPPGINNTKALTDSFIPTILGGIALVVGIGVVLTIWFRRGDVAVQQRLQRMRQAPAAFSEPTGEDVAE